MSQEEVDAANRLIIDLISKYRVIIAGCRDFADYELLKEKCDFYLQNKEKEDIIIVSGHASGADALGEICSRTRFSIGDISGRLESPRKGSWTNQKC